MSGAQVQVTLPETLEQKQRCHISLSDHGIDIDFYPALPDEPHKPSRVEIMAAGALLGIARALTGQGAQQVIHALAQFDREIGRKKR